MGDWLASRSLVILAFVVLFAVGVALGVAGVPTVPVAFGASVVGVALVTGHITARRGAASKARTPRGIEGMSVRIPVTRLGFDTKWWHLKFISPTREVVAPGTLWVGPGRMEFVPSEARHDDRAWAAEVRTVELVRVFGRECMLRLSDAPVPAQFGVHAPPDDTRAALAPLLEVAELTERV